MKIGIAEHITEQIIQFLDTFWHISAHDFIRELNIECVEL
jgi:hypothetical protein